MTHETCLIPVVDLSAWVTCVMTRVAVPETDAAIASDVLVSANLRGVDSHGVVRLPLYIRRLQAGAVNIHPVIQIERDSPSAILVDGGNGLGLVVGVWAMREVIRRTRDYGVAVAAVRHSNHFGAAAYYAQLAAAAGMIGFSFTNTDAGMAPWGSVTPYLGTNPLAFAAPGGIEGGIVLDMATSQVAWGKVLLAAQAGQKIPLGWATDRSGHPTDDAHEAQQGLMLPLGGYKGYGLALMIEVLCGILTGAAFGSHVDSDSSVPYHPQEAGHFFMAIDIQRFLPLSQFQMRMQQMVDEIHACQPAEGVGRIYVPGEIEQETAEQREREGIPILESVLAELRALGEWVGQPFPTC